MKYGIGGIKYQNKLEKLPFFNKKTAGILIEKKGNNLDKKIQRLLDKNYLINLKKGWYVTRSYLDKEERIEIYGDYLANKLRKPSYLSLEYMLQNYNLIPQAVNVWTSISLKTTRSYENEIGSFVYKNIKNRLYKGYDIVRKGKYNIYQARKAKALFDYLYLKVNISDNLEYELKEGLRINWDEFLKKDLKEFSQFTAESQMKKMQEILKIINKIKNVN